MADKHPYTSGQSSLAEAVAHLRRSFPASVTADTLKKLGIAPNNETYILNILRFLGILDEENKKNASAAPTFNKHDDMEFREEFAKLVFDAYHELFDLHGPAAWELPLDKLVSFFRNHDSTSDVVGKRQAATFQTLARLSGKLPEGAKQNGTPKTSRPAAATKTAKPPRSKTTPSAKEASTTQPASTFHGSTDSSHYPSGVGMALTVRVEINLPAEGDQETYDRIFKSIRENLLNGNRA